MAHRWHANHAAIYAFYAIYGPPMVPAGAEQSHSVREQKEQRGPTARELARGQAAERQIVRRAWPVRSNAITYQHQVGSDRQTVSAVGEPHGVPTKLATLQFGDLANPRSTVNAVPRTFEQASRLPTAGHFQVPFTRWPGFGGESH
jgi:hypothetical protein